MRGFERFAFFLEGRRETPKVSKHNLFLDFLVFFTELLLRDIFTPGLLDLFVCFFLPIYNRKLIALDYKLLLCFSFCKYKLPYQIQMCNMQRFICPWVTSILHYYAKHHSQFFPSIFYMLPCTTHSSKKIQLKETLISEAFQTVLVITAFYLVQTQ